MDYFVKCIAAVFDALVLSCQVFYFLFFFVTFSRLPALQENRVNWKTISNSRLLRESQGGFCLEGDESKKIFFLKLASCL